MRSVGVAVRYVLHRPSGLLGAVILVTLVAVAVIAPPLLTDHARELHLDQATQGPSWDHLAGTDELGRDVFSRVLVAARMSLMLALAAAGLGAVLGIPLGALTAVLGPRSQRVVARVITMGLVFPAVLVALFLTTIIGPGPKGAIIAIGVALAPGFARTAQTLAAGIASSEYVAAARVVGVSRKRLLMRYVLPNISETLVLQVAGSISTALVAVAALSFLGLGVQTPDFDWGSLLNSGLKLIYVVPATALVPATAIILAGLCFNLLGESFAKGLNPRLRIASAGGAPGPMAATGPIADVEALEPVVTRAAGAAAAVDGEPVLRVRDLVVRFEGSEGAFTVVDGANLDIARGEMVGIVGESGSGKTMLAMAIAGLVPHPGRVEAAELRFHGRDLQHGPPRELRKLLGTKMAIVFQDPMSSLNPVRRIGTQLTEGVRVHRGMRKAAARQLAVERLTDVHIPAAERRLRQYPHEFSGGMRQRAMIAAGLMGEPDLIIADEPTTALDVTIQAQILELLREVNRERGAAVLLISHDLGVISQLCDRVLVMYAGRIVEQGSMDELRTVPAHPYTAALLEAVPDLHVDVEHPLRTIPGAPPDPRAMPSGCRFAPRCPLAFDRCAQQPPPVNVAPGRLSECWLADELVKPRELASV
ncbi:MAG: dipeptide/oligopeptide/nickel ABC transporter permease/ATP-binding protein [Gaiellaceae bacterium]